LTSRGWEAKFFPRPLTSFHRWKEVQRDREAKFVPRLGRINPSHQRDEFLDFSLVRSLNSNFFSAARRGSRTQAFAFPAIGKSKLTLLAREKGYPRDYFPAAGSNRQSNCFSPVRTRSAMIVILSAGGKN
jgi:hypothetical protein